MLWLNVQLIPKLNFLFYFSFFKKIHNAYIDKVNVYKVLVISEMTLAYCLLLFNIHKVVSNVRSFFIQGPNLFLLTTTISFMNVNEELASAVLCFFYLIQF